MPPASPNNLLAILGKLKDGHQRKASGSATDPKSAGVQGSTTTPSLLRTSRQHSASCVSTGYAVASIQGQDKGKTVLREAPAAPQQRQVHLTNLTAKQATKTTSPKTATAASSKGMSQGDAASTTRTESSSIQPGNSSYGQALSNAGRSMYEAQTSSYGQDDGVEATSSTPHRRDLQAGIFANEPPRSSPQSLMASVQPFPPGASRLTAQHSAHARSDMQTTFGEHQAMRSLYAGVAPPGSIRESAFNRTEPSHARCDPRDNSGVAMQTDKTPEPSHTSGTAAGLDLAAITSYHMEKEKTIATLQAQVDHLEGFHRELILYMENLHGENKEQREKLQQMVETAQASLQKSESLLAQWDDDRYQNDQQYYAVATQLHDSKASSEAIKEVVDEKIAALHELQAEVTSYKTKLHDICGDLQVLDREAAKVAELETALEVTKKAGRHIDKDRTELREEVTTLKQDLSDAQSKLAHEEAQCIEKGKALQKAQEETYTQAIRIAELQKEVASFEKLVVTAEGQNEHLITSLKTGVDHANDALRVMAEERNLATTTIDHLHANEQQMSKALDEVKQAKAGLEVEIAKAYGESTALKQALQERDNKMSETITLLHNTQAEKIEALEQKASAVRAVNDLRTTVVELENKVEKVSDEVVKLTTEKALLQHSTKMADSEAKAARDEAERSQAAAAIHREDLVRLEMTLQQEKALKSDIQKTLHHAQDQTKITLQERDELRLRIAQIESEKTVALELKDKELQVSRSDNATLQKSLRTAEESMKKDKVTIAGLDESVKKDKVTIAGLEKENAKLCAASESAKEDKITITSLKEENAKLRAAAEKAAAQAQARASHSTRAPPLPHVSESDEEHDESSGDHQTSVNSAETAPAGPSKKRPSPQRGARPGPASADETARPPKRGRKAPAVRTNPKRAPALELTPGPDDHNE